MFPIIEFFGAITEVDIAESDLVLNRWYDDILEKPMASFAYEPFGYRFLEEYDEFTCWGKIFKHSMNAHRILSLIVRDFREGNELPAKVTLNSFDGAMEYENRESFNFILPESLKCIKLKDSHLFVIDSYKFIYYEQKVYMLNVVNELFPEIYDEVASYYLSTTKILL